MAFSDSGPTLVYIVCMQPLISAPLMQYSQVPEPPHAWVWEWDQAQSYSVYILLLSLQCTSVCTASIHVQLATCRSLQKSYVGHALTDMREPYGV